MGHQSIQLDQINHQGRSFYLYDESMIRVKIRELKRYLTEFDFLYSVKTNPFAPVVSCMVSSGFGADAASANEVFFAKQAGANKEDIYYSAPGKSQADVERALGNCTIIADSLGELAMLNKLARQHDITLEIGVRINPVFTMDGTPAAPAKFGVDEEQLLPNKEWIAGFENLRIIGIHTHVRSQILDWKTLANYYRAVADLAYFCKNEMEWDLRFVNFGGGFGIPYCLDTDLPLDLAALAQESNQVLRELRNALGVRLLAETGRFVICQAGSYITPILDIKRSRGKTYIIVQNGLTGFFRPSIAAMVEGYPMNEPYAVEPFYTGKNSFTCDVVGRDSPKAERVDIVGNLCAAADILACDIPLQHAEVGDFICVSNAGAYAYTFTPMLFSSHPAPVQMFRSENGTYLE